MMPNKLNNWEGGEAPQEFSWKSSIDETSHPVYEIQLGPFAQKMSQTLKEIVLMLAKMKHFIIIDDVAFDSTAVNIWREVLKVYKVLWFGIKTPLPILEERERLRGNRMHGTARAQYFKVHKDITYELEFDTSKEFMKNIVQTIKEKLCQTDH